MSPDRPGRRLCLVDGSGVVFRAYHALPSLATRTGIPTGAIYGFATMLAKLLRTNETTHLAVVIDAPGKTFRDEAFADYKATRTEMPDDLARQLPYIRQVVQAFGIPLLEVPGVEADDVIGTLATRAAAEGFEVLIVTSDKDMMQLVGPNVRLLDTMYDRTTGVDEVRTRFGVDPAHVVDVMALMGDAIDNIPGIKGIGEKTAARLISHFGSLDALYARLAEVESIGLRGAQRVRAMLEAGQEIARTSRFLATIRRDVELAVEPSALVRGPQDAATLRALSTELEFASLRKDLPDDGGARASARAVRVASQDEVDALVRGAKAIAVAVLPGTGPVYAPGPPRGVAVGAPDFPEVLYAAGLPSSVRAALLSGAPGTSIYVDDLKAALHAAALDGETMPEADGARLHDTALLAYAIDASRRAYTIDALAAERLERSLPPLDALTPETRAGAIADALLEIGPALAAELEAAGLGALYRDLELPLARVLARVEARGIAVDRAALEAAGNDFRAAAAALESEIHALAGGPFNIQSPIQLREVLFERLKLPTKGIKRGKTGLSVDADVLARLAESHPIAAKVCEHRALLKLISTYVSSLVELVDPQSGRLHTSFNQTVAATGRLSSSEPNLQNIPVRSVEGRRIRAAFVAPPGARLVAGDYSQIELRVLAHLTEDPVLVEAFRAGEDIHRRTAAEVFGVAADGVTPEMRRQAKVINFGIIYGMGPQRLARELGIPLAEADDYIRRYFARYSRVRAYAERVVEAGRRDGFVSTMIGRRRHLPDLNSRVPNLRQAAERMAWNSPIQGTAADIIKLAMLVVERDLERRGGRARMLLQVHDELLLEVPEPEVEETAHALRSGMESVVALAVPLVVDLKQGPNWASMA